MKNKPALVEGKKYVITGATEHSISKSVGVYFPQVVTYTGGEFDGVEPEYGLSKRWPVSNFEYKECNTTKVRIKPYRNGFRFEITFVTEVGFTSRRLFLRMLCSCSRTCVLRPAN